MINIRPACPEDINDISCVLAASWKTAYRGIIEDDYLDALSDTHWVDFLTYGLHGNSIIVMVMESNSQIIGAAIMSETENSGECGLRAFYLLPDKIGQGLGQIFYNSIENEMKNRGFSSCALDVLENNARAIRFYKKQGFLDTSKELNVDLGENSYLCKIFKKTI